MSKDSVTDEMLRILSGEAPPEEVVAYYRSLEADPEQAQVFHDFKRNWEVAAEAMIYRDLDEEGAWERQKAMVLRENISLWKKSTRLWPWAATVLLAVGIVLYMLLGNEKIDSPVSPVTSSAGQQKEAVLRDGSVITLNENSSLNYEITEAGRKAWLQGEGFFQVKSDKNKPFEIQTTQAIIKVLGTSFNIQSKKESTVVFVKEGQVELIDINRKHKVLLEAGFIGEVSANKFSKHLAESENITSWYDHKLVFFEEPLKKVIKDIERTYYVSFAFDSDSIKGCNLTGDFNRESLENVLSTLNLIFNLEFETENGRTYRISGAGCP